MLQVACFQLPDQQDEANAFLAKHKPRGEIAFNHDLIFIGYDNGVYSPVDEIAELRELLHSVNSAKFQQEVAIHVMEYERADLNAKHNKPRFDELSAAITATRRALDIQDTKAAFVQKRIDALKSGDVYDKATAAQG